MALVSTELLDRLTAAASKPVALAYGRHVVAGNLILRDDQEEPQQSVLFVALGEGEWDSVETLYFNGVALDPSKYHFHPGKDGEVGAGGVTGDQKIDLWFPAGLTGLTFSRTAYVAILADDTVYAPADPFDVRGIFKTRKVRKFDAGGAQTAYEYSANLAWCILDVLLLREPAARINFASFLSESAYCDDLLTIDGVQYPRFECHIAFPAQVDLGRALETMLAIGRGYLFEDEGKIHFRIDKARAAAHTFTRANSRDFKHWRRETRQAPNRLKVKFRDLENDFKFDELVIEREWHQELIGKVNEEEIDLGNTVQNQARRIGEYYETRAIDDQAMASIVGYQSSVHLQPGDRVDMSADIAPWDGLKAWEVIELSDTATGEREIRLQEYDANAFNDTGQPLQLTEGGVIVGPAQIPAGKVINISASENKYISPVDGKVWSRVTASWDEPSPLRTYKGCALVVRRRASGGAPTETFREIGRFEEPPGAFLVPATGDDLEIAFVSYNIADRLNAVATAPSTIVALDAEPSAPAAVAGLWAQQLTEGIRLSWNEGAETNLRSYQIAAVGELVPANDSEITDAHVIAVVPARPGAASRATFDWKRKRYEGDSNGTVITLDADVNAKFFPVGALVVGGVGRALTLFESDGSTTAATVVSNTERTITCGASSLPSGRVFFEIRGASAVEHFYARPDNTSGQVGPWRPVPPAILEVFPFDRLGTKDASTVSPFWNGSVSAATSFLLMQPNLSRPGGFLVALRAIAAPEAETDFDKALKQSINSILTWEVEITHSADGVTGLTTTVFSFPAAKGRENYSIQNIPPGVDVWVLNNVTPFVEFPNQGIDSCRARCENSYGWGPWTILGVFAGGAKPWFTGNGTVLKEALLTPNGSNNVYPNLAESQTFRVTAAANFTVQKPEYRSRPQTPGTGANAKIGEEFTIIQDTDGIAAHFNPAYFAGLNGKPTDLRAGRYTAWRFRTVAVDKFRCISYELGIK